MDGRQQLRNKQPHRVSLTATVMCFDKEGSHDVFRILSFNIKKTLK